MPHAHILVSLVEKLDTPEKARNNVLKDVFR